MSTAQVKQILIESKSTPRSGLHFLKALLSTYLNDHFSFCERYNEPGCCGYSPCKLVCFLKDAENGQSPHLRLAKSHDFRLKDIKPKTSENLRVLILKRDPVYVITSWWELHEITRHKEVMMKHRIFPTKILYQHEKPLINAAFALIDAHYQPPKDHEFKNWLLYATNYIKNFQDKWLIENDDPYTEIVDYFDIQNYAMKVVAEITGKKVGEGFKSDTQKFTARDNPFIVKSSAISAQLQTHQDLILEMLHQNNLETTR